MTIALASVLEVKAEDLVSQFKHYAASDKRRRATIQIVDYLNSSGIKGAMVECGVWRGGHMLVAAARCKQGCFYRKFYLYDTFEGMPPPTKQDHKPGGSAGAVLNRYSQNLKDKKPWNCASLDEVKAAFAKFDLLGDSVTFVKGKVEDTLLNPANLPDRISYLRLDTDWYSSTKLELEVLYPRLVSGGVLVVDDYGHWMGAQKAANDYFRTLRKSIWKWIDYSAVMYQKL